MPQAIDLTEVAKSITVDTVACVHCGACTTFCRYSALRLDAKTWRLVYEREKCISCLRCLSVCPFGLIRQHA